jgi:hypothetical protein
MQPLASTGADEVIDPMQIMASIAKLPRMVFMIISMHYARAVNSLRLSDLG